MNKAITDGINFMPAPFAQGLGAYSSGHGTPGSDTYAGAPNAAFVPADQDFGGALELIKTSSTQRLRYMGQTQLLPGCYLRITARVKAISGDRPSVRIAGYPAKANGTEVTGVVGYGPSTTLGSYGDVVEVSAIVAAGNRSGVDMVWGTQAIYGHFGLDLTGPNGGLVRIDDLVIEDITEAFLPDMLAIVDVRDYGALGNGSTDDTAAFERANAAANGRTVLIPSGTFRLNGDVTFDAPTKFEGKLSMATSAILLLRRNFDLPSYVEAFEDEVLAFKKAFQALLNNADHDSLDLGGRKISVSAPIDMQAAVPNRSDYATRRVIRNGQFEADSNGAWATQTVSSQASYDPGNARRLSNVTNVANVAVGARVSGNGVGREVYVRSKNVATQEITLSYPLYDAAGTQNYSFSHFKHVLDFSGFNSLKQFIIDDVEIQCNNVASGINLSPAGITFTLRDCFISRPKDKGITSIGEGCQGMFVDRCQFLSGEDADNVAQRVSIAINANANDVKLRDNRATRFRHFALLGGSNSMVQGNHFFQGDGVANGQRTAGIILTEPHNAGTIVGNYIDNSSIEWTNEHSSEPHRDGGFSFSALGIVGNNFLASDVASGFSFIVVKPHGTAHGLNGLNITGNRFRCINGSMNRAERVDTSFSDIDGFRNKNIEYSGNSFHNVTQYAANPLKFEHTENAASTTWVIETGTGLPFDGWARAVDSVVAVGNIRRSNNTVYWGQPYVKLEQGSNNDKIHLVWETAVKGTVQLAVRMDANS
ncbi:MAG: glycosyl hydrolase family 28-related protein [Sulfitobacter sp.]